MSHGRKLVWIAIAAVIIAGAIIGSFLAHRGEPAEEAESDEPIKNATRVMQAGGETTVRFDRATQQRLGIQTVAVAAVTKRGEISAYGRLEEDPSRSFVLRAPVAGIVEGTPTGTWPDVGQALADRAMVGSIDPRLLPTDRITLSDRLATARADAEAGRASLATAQAALVRIRTLNADDKNVSDRAVQEAEARVAAEQARFTAATQTAALIETSLKSTHDAAAPLEMLRGGQVVEILAHPGESVESGQAILRVTGFDQLLARIDVPAGETIAGNVENALILPLGLEDHPLRGERVALASTVDPKTQGEPFLFRVSNPLRTLRPGLSVTAFLELPGPARSGVVVPRAAVVRQSGRTWVYVQTGAEQFARRLVALEEPVTKGWFTRSVSSGDRVVTVGAQTLLSEEFKSQIQVGEENEQ